MGVEVGQRPRTSVVAEVVVRQVRRVSPSFVRVWLAGPELSDFGVEGAMSDQRIKLIFPGPDGSLPQIGAGNDWYSRWSALDESAQGYMRTYTPRDLVDGDEGVELVVDVVVHEHGPSGPGNDWALAAQPGDRVTVVGPRRGSSNGGIEFEPRGAERLLVVGDETAAPAVYGILRDLSADALGCALIEVPTSGDVLEDVTGPAGVEIEWLPRDGADRGSLLWAATLRRLGDDDWRGAPPVIADADVPDLVWETPVGEGPSTGTNHYSDLYAWIAGEAGIVTGLRRHLVRDLGIDRSQVAFMGYWRQAGVVQS